VDVETSKTNPITGRRQVTQSSHNSDDVLEIRDPKMQYKTDNENHEDEDNDDYNDNEDKQEHSGSPSSDEKKVKANSAMKTEAAKEATSNWETDVEHWELNAVRWAHAIVFYGSIYLPWLCLALLILGVMIEIFDITSNFEDDYKKQPPMTSEKVGYCIVHQTPTQKTAETNNAIVQVCKQ
jgi:lipopolysaccharide export LptBFGC system permease protein LptF